MLILTGDSSSLGIQICIPRTSWVMLPDVPSQQEQVTTSQGSVHEEPKTIIKCPLQVPVP